MNLYKYPFMTFLDIFQNIWKFNPAHFTELKELAQKNEQEDPEDSAHLLTRRHQVASFHFARRLTHISVEVHSRFIFSRYTYATYGQLCVTRSSFISVRRFTRMHTRALMG